MADACREYQSSLEDLTFNSKPHINMLTILAEENLSCASDIGAIIEAQISKAPSMEKLPVLYLVDSIVKNVGGEYTAVFAKNLITSFICVFDKVDENTRKSLFKLRSTWEEVFPLKKLYALDVRVNAVDPAWPIKPLPPTVNSSSIHVNPKFLKQSDEASSPQPAPAKPSAPKQQQQQPPPAVFHAPVPPHAPIPPAPSPSSLTQEQLIRQQLLAKQKQLLELQQKKIELELEQTKAQLAGGFVMPTSAPSPVNTPQKPPVAQPAPVVRPWMPSPQPHPEPKPPTRDPRLNRSGPPAKEPHAGRKADLTSASGSPGTTPEKPARPDRTRTPRKEAPDERNKSKSQSPAAKNLQSKNKQVEAELQKSSDVPKKDPRLKKRPQEKVSGELNPEEQREKRRTPENKEAARAKSKLLNGSLVKHEHESVTVDKPDFKTGGNARTHARKRTRSRSRSPTAAASPKRKDRRSPKSHGARSGSLSPSPSHKPGKARSRPPRPEEPKKNQAEGRRSKRPEGDRDSSHSPRGHDVIGKEGKDAQPRWRSGWEENKHLKSPEEAHVKPSPLRHKPYGTPTRPAGPRTPKHRLSVDANMQIPEVLNSASKKDLLRRASKRLESGEISQEDFLNMAHQIKHFFQYQEEKQLQRSASWDPTAKPGNMDAAELTYYQHKSKLRKTQVMAHRAPGEEGWEGEESPEEGEGPGDKAGRPPPLKYNRPSPRDRQGERRSKEPEEPRAPLGPMIEEYNHGKEFPTLKSLPGLRFRRRADPRETKRSELRFWSASRSGKLQQGEREWTSPLTERQRYDEEQKSGYDAPRRFIPSDPRRAEALLPPPPPLGPTVHRNSPEAGLRFERERLSPLHQKDPAAPVELSPAPRFESPNSEHSDEGPMSVDAPLAPGPLLPPPGGPGPVRTGPLAAVRHSDSPGHTPPHDALPPPRYEGLPGRPNPPGWYEPGPGPGPGRYEDQGRFDGPPLHQQQQGPGRFDPPHHNMADRFEPQHMNQHGPMGRFDGPGRFDGHMNQQRFDGPMPRFNNNSSSSSMAPNGPMGFQQQRPMRFDGPPNQMSPMRFDGPGPMRFEGPGQPGPPRFDMPNVPQHFDCPPGQQNMMFGPQHGMQQPPMRPMAPPHYDAPMPPQQGFNMGPQRFPEPMNNMNNMNPMNAPPFPQGPLPFNQPGNFNMQPGPFNQPGPGPFYNPQQPQVNMMNMNQPFLPQNQVPFGQQAPPVAPPENHFGQVDVNDLLSKLISTGIIKPSQPEAPPTAGTEPSPAAPAVPVAVEEEEEEEQEVEEDDDLPDLTGFTVDDMKLRYESVVTRLYSGNQCCLCSMRFTAAQTDLYADHLDWHFRQNHAGKTVGKKITHRRWYYGLRDWVEFEEIADLEERAKSNFFEKESEEEVQKSQAAAKEKEFQCVRAAKDQVGELCEICQEPFETYWVEEEEDWFLKNALRVDDKNFHPSCFEDYKNTSSYMDVSPSPSKLLTEHPLSAFIKTEEEEGTTTSCCEHTVKQEAMSEEAELTTDIKTEEEEEEKDVEKEEEEVLTSSEPAEENKL